MQPNNNPLIKHFRQASVYLDLPSKGEFWPDGTLEISNTSELAVYSMTACDEILLKTPDALVNGSATVGLIQSCIPQIKNAWAVPACDLDAILISIRLASSGNELPVQITCPKCKQQDEYEIDLQQFLSTIKYGNWEENLVIGELEIKFQPLPFKKINEFNNRNYKHQKTLRALEFITDEDERENITNALIKDVNTSNLEFIKASIKQIHTKSEVVTNPDFLSEFIDNCNKTTFTLIKNNIELLKSSCKSQNIELICSQCQNEINTPLNLDFSSFFI